MIIEDRVKETSTSIGIGNFVLSGTSGPFKTFASVCSVGDTFWYCIYETAGINWEIGIGTYLAPNTIQRTTVSSSSVGNNRVNFGAGTKEVFITVAASTVAMITDTGAKTLLGRKEVSSGEVQQLSVTDVNSMIKSSTADNRINTSIDGGLYVPELETDPLAFYILAKA